MAVGWNLYEGEKFRYRRVCDATALLRFIKSRIEYFLMPSLEIFRRADAGYLSEIGFTEYAAEHGLAQTLRAEPFASLFPPRARALLTDFADTLGSGCAEEEVRRCDFFLEELSAVQTEMKDDLARKGKLYISMSVLAAAAVTILLI